MVVSVKPVLGYHAAFLAKSSKKCPVEKRATNPTFHTGSSPRKRRQCTRPFLKGCVAEANHDGKTPFHRIVTLFGRNYGKLS
jgi:hypothetical protein